MSTPTHAAEIIREALNLLYHAAYAQGHHDTVEGCYTHVLSSDRHTYHDEAVQDLLRDEELRSLALLADMEREGEVVAWASKDQLEKLDFVGDMMVSSEKDETFSVPYDIPLYTHPSPTTADAKDSRSKPQSSVDEVMKVVKEEVSHEPDRWRVLSRLTKMFKT